MPLDFEPPIRHTAETVLWRYLPLIDLINIVEFNKLRFTSIAKFREQDRHEGQPPEDYATLWAEAPLININGEPIQPGSGETQPDMTNIEIAAHMLFACCFHENQNESVLMWNSYPGTDVAIRVPVLSLIRAFSEVIEDIKVRWMKYGDTCKAVGIEVSRDFRDGRAIFGSKRAGYQHENEVRLFWYPPIKEFIPNTPEPYLEAVRELYLRRAPRFQELAIQGSKMISGVAISPRKPPHAAIVIERYLQEHGINHLVSNF